MKINKTYPAKAVSYGATRSASEIKYICVHYTGNVTDKAENNAKYFNTTNTRAAGAHYFVDDTSIFQSILDSKIAYAVGGSRLVGTVGGTMHGKVTNRNSISVEMCSTKSAITSKTIENTIWLIKSLMEKYNIPASNVYRHYDVTGKICPGWEGWTGTNAKKWSNFKAKLTANAEASTVEYYPKYSGSSTSIVVALGASGEKNTSLTNRKKIATANGITPYQGTSTQNIEMLALLKAGKLKKA